MRLVSTVIDRERRLKLQFQNSDGFKPIEYFGINPITFGRHIPDEQRSKSPGTLLCYSRWQYHEAAVNIVVWLGLA